MKLSKIQGVVIKEVNTGEADKIITIFSKRLGKIQAGAKGARRPQSRLIAGTQFLSFSDFVLSKGQDLYNVRDCQIIESFYNIRENLQNLTYAVHIVDLVNEVSDENLPYPKLMQLLLNTLHMLSQTDKSPELITRIFEIRLMSIVGFEPQVMECQNCGEVPNEGVVFSPKLGGIVCPQCLANDKTSVRISNGTLNALRYIIYSDDKKVFSFNVSENVLRELKEISTNFLEAHLNRKFEKLKFLNEIKIQGTTKDE